jgi:hypothetical protein
MILWIITKFDLFSDFQIARRGRFAAKRLAFKFILADYRPEKRFEFQIQVSFPAAIFAMFTDYKK